MESTLLLPAGAGGRPNASTIRWDCPAPEQRKTLFDALPLYQELRQNKLSAAYSEHSRYLDTQEFARDVSLVLGRSRGLNTGAWRWMYGKGL